MMTTSSRIALLLAASCLHGAAPGSSPIILGSFEDDYGSRYRISMQEWVQVGYARYEIEELNLDEQYAIARNHADNPTGAGLWSRIDWLTLSGMEPYTWAFCLTAFEAASADAARSTPPADRSTPRTGCGGYPFSRMKPAQAGDPVTLAGLAFERTELRAGVGEAELVVADLNGDGVADLTVTSSQEETVAVLMGTGYGSLADGRSYPAGDTPTHVLVDDLDGGGVPDILIANHETDYLTLLTGESEWETSTRIPVPVRPHPHWVVSVDLNQDGHADILVDDRQGEAVLMLDGAAGPRESRRGIDVGGDPYLGFAVGDLNGDGHLDLVSPNPREVGIVFGTGGGEFQPPRFFRPGFAPSAVAVCDTNGDGHLDLVTASGENGSEIAVALNDGNGTFHPHFQHTTVRGLKKLTTGDVNADGYCDLMVSAWTGGPTLLLGGADDIEVAPIPVRGNPWGLALGDLNGDGFDDLLIADGQTDAVQVFLSVDR